MIEAMFTDKERLDFLDRNFYHREMDDFDKKVRGTNTTMWVIFAPQGPQGNIRRVVDAMMTKERK